MVDKHDESKTSAKTQTGHMIVQNETPCGSEEQEALRQSERKFRMLFHNAGDAIFLWELIPGGAPVLIEANEIAARRLGYRLGDMPGMLLTDISPMSPDEMSVTIGKVIAEKHRTFESAYRTRDGAYIPIEISSHVFKLGEKTVMLSIARDISARKAESKSLTEAYNREKKLRQDLETEIGKRVDFTRALVHELKTPLTPLIASGEALLEISQGETELRLAGNIYRGAMNLERRINDLLDYARGEMGVLKVRVQPLNISPLLLDLAAEVSPQFDRKQQSLELEIDDDIPLVTADEDRLRQVLLNLLNNAAKFTQRGGQITIGATVSGKMLQLSVADTGRGMSPEEQAHIFKPYYRVEDEIDPNDGMGIGLTLCKMLVTLQGGDIWFESEKGRGSTFYFTLPLAMKVERDG
ncbi:PAS domain-containing sensor histidine kinase [Dehalogenimonas etheniformans]|uniref:histidine kinase n=1 Tax=Dehalogenimonas etheniformans TaxID=1536648 RepID=A0A2P5P928_9CHLR|nr:PAS domain-containing sensor histidine kinase [Dehalogenimonas etheniformans]PPD58790.1 PAS domain-containing sensor histidine kinase [Dehalogenimonas etheniformans]QNT76440.1 PAS domain S-box protein [Dehalogenimonas etheniformans]